MRVKVVFGAGLILLVAAVAFAYEFTQEDLEKWQKEYEKVVAEGYALFHSPLGTNNVSCDMCHPNASNNHPETYPKFQIQLGQVVELRDMINWCIQNPEEGQALKADDPRMIALEAYIKSERKGVPLAPGKH
jgi:cytochrome c